MQLLSLFAAASAMGLVLAAPSKLAKRAGKMQWVGVNESGPEFGDGIFPGRYGTEFIWPTLSTYDTFIARGFNTFRINFYMERLIPNSLSGSPDPGYLRNLTEQIDYVTSKGAYAMVQPHNYGRYYKEIITDTSGFQKWWQTVASQYKDNSRVIWDTNNEYVGQAGKPTHRADRADTDTTPCPLNWLSL
jgi:endoglucanase